MAKEKGGRLRKALGVIPHYMDDLLILAGIGFFIRAGFLLGEVVGWAACGAGCIAYGVIVAKGGAGKC